MGKKLDPADQFHVIQDEQLRAAFIGMADVVDEQARKEIVATYSDPKLASAFRAWRNYNDLNKKGFTDKGNMREIVRIPAGHVYEFLKAYFTPLYGEKWIQNIKALKHPLVRPWWLVSHI
jgi:hypothetical protein